MTTRPDLEERIIDEAIAWQQALASDDADWDGYVEWLEADPRHRAAYDEITLLDHAIDHHAPALRPLLATSPPTAPPGMPPRRRLRFVGAAAAAAVAAVIAVPMLLAPAPDRIYATGSRPARGVALASGVSADLAPHSRLIAVHGRANQLRLDDGAVFLDVRHDPARPLTIEAAGYVVTDVGTRFNVAAAGDYVAVAVAEGSVAVAPPGAEARPVGAGQQLLARRGTASARLVTVTPADVGGWRSGRLVYNEAPLSIVAAELSRHTGTTVTVDPAVRAETFTGVLTIADGPASFRNLAQLMGLGYRVEGRSVRLSAGERR